MKKMKKLLAMLLTVVMTAGVINLPVQAADIPVTFTIVSADANKFRLGSSAYPTPASDVNFFANSEDAKIVYTQGNKVVEKTQIAWSEWDMYLHADEGVFEGITSAQAGDTLRLTGIWSAGDNSGTYDFGDVTYKCNGSTWSEYIPPVDFEIIGIGECGSQPSLSRWLLRFKTSVTLPGGDFATHMGDRNVTISGGGTTGSKTGSFYDGGSGGLGLIVPFTAIPQDANGYQITIPAGTEVTYGTQTYRLSKEVTYKNVNGAWKEVVLPTDIAITGAGPCGAQPTVNNGRWLFRVHTTATIPGSGFSNYVGNFDIKISGGGSTVTKKAEFYDGGEGGTLGFIVPFTDLPLAAEGYQVTLLAGTSFTFSGVTYKIVKDASLVCKNGEWEMVVPKTPITITGMGDCGKQDNIGGGRWLMRFNTSAEIAGDAFSTHLGNVNLQVNDVATTVEVYPSESRTFAIPVPYTALPASAAEGTKVTIPAGVIGDYELTEAYTAVYKEGAWTTYVPEAQKTQLTITGVSGCGAQPEQNRWLMRFNTSVKIDGEAFVTHLADYTVLVNDTSAVANVYTSDEQNLALILGFASLAQTPAEGTTLTIPAGVIGDYELTEAFTAEYKAGSWVTYVPETPKTSVTITGVSGCGAQPEQSRWLMRFATSVEIAGDAFGTHLADYSVLVNGTSAVANVYTSDEKNFGVILGFASLAETPAEGTILTIPAGVIGDYELTEAFTAEYKGGAWTTYVPETTKMKFTITGIGECGAQLNQNRWLMRFTTSAEIAGEAFGTFLAEPPILVNDGAVNAPMYPTEGKGLGVIIPFSTLQEVPAEGTTVTIPAGVIGDYELTEAYTAEYKDGKWQVYVPRTSYDFSITGIGNCEYDADSGWKIRFETDSSLASKDFETGYAAFTIKVNGKDTEVGCIAAANGDLEVLVSAGLSAEPQGSVVAIAPGTIGKYTLLNSYKVVYDVGAWKLAHEATPMTLNWSHDRADIQIYTVQDSGNVFVKGLYTPAYTDSGVFLNGKRLDGVGLQCYATAASNNGVACFHINADEIGWNEALDNILTIRGTFFNGNTYVELSEVSTRFDGSVWVSCHSYENFNRVTVTDVETGAWQPNLMRWLFRVATSTPIEVVGEEFGQLNMGPLSVTITPPEGVGRTISTTAYYANNPTNTAVNRLGFVVSTAEGLPENAEGYSVTIQPGILTSVNKTYKLTEACILKCVGGVWQIQTERPLKTGVRGDANGDGAFNTLDLIRAKKELTGVKGVLSTTDALFAGKTVITEYDVIHIREMFLNDLPSVEGYIPVYSDDEAITLAAYKGPSALEQDLRYDSQGNLLTNYTKKSFLTDEEFARYKRAGLNTMIAEADAPFGSEGPDALGSGGGHWTNLVSYMNLAANHGLDVYVTSDALNAYLRGQKVTKADGSGDEVTVTDEFMMNDLTQMLTGAGSHTHATEGMLDYDNFKGVMLADELRYSSLGYYTTVNQFLRTLAPNIDVLTSFESSDAAVGADYQTFATDFANASLNNRFSYDYYLYQGAAKRVSGWGSWATYNYSEDLAKTSTTWISKLENSAAYGLAGGYDTGITLQSFGMENHASKVVYKAPTTEAEIGFEVYTALAYGMKQITYFTYFEHNRQDPNGEIYTSAMIVIDENGNPVETDTYRAVQAVNNKILQFDHVFLDYDWRSTIKINANSLLSGLAQGSSDRIASYSATNAAIIGCMRDTEKNLDGFWIVNATTPEEDKSNTVTVTFDNATRAMVYNPAANVYGEVVSLTNGTYTANLGSGEGQFVIPLQ